MVSVASWNCVSASSTAVSTAIQHVHSDLVLPGAPRSGAWFDLAPGHALRPRALPTRYSHNPQIALERDELRFVFTHMEIVLAE